jgi:MPBQ/MSBQ methyltransferase
MLEFAAVSGSPAKLLDVGCGIGGTTRHLARKFGPATQLTGITLSPNQAARATELAAGAGLGNCEFRVMDALAMEFADNTFDFVWACESGEHMPDKKKYVEEMVRVLKPGGTLVIATWCQREPTPEAPITAAEQEELRFLYEEWSHPYFISIEEYARLLQGTGAAGTVISDDWAKQTIPAWRHSIWAGVWDPWPVVARPHVWYKTVRDIVCLEKMHQAFAKGLMTYGMLRMTKKVPAAVASEPALVAL